MTTFTTNTYQIEALGETYTFTATESSIEPITSNWVIWHSGTTQIGKGYSDLAAARRSMKGRLRTLSNFGIAASGATREATVIA